jgi:hypothetical protein
MWCAPTTCSQKLAFGPQATGSYWKLPERHAIHLRAAFPPHPVAVVGFATLTSYSAFSRSCWLFEYTLCQLKVEKCSAPDLAPHFF